MFRELILLFVCLREIYSNSSDGDTTKVDNGYRCSIADHPYMVVITLASNATIHSSGTLVNPKWVLTSRHSGSVCSEKHYCMVIAGIESPWKNATVYEKNQTGQFSLVNSFHPHETDDIGLINLERSFKKSKTVDYVNLATWLNVKDKKLEDICDNSTVLGWVGINYEPLPELKTTHTRASWDPNLQCVQIPLISQESCNEKLKPITNGTISNSTFCAFRNNTEACDRNAGGPLMCNGLQYGMVSGAYGCPKRGYPTLFVKVYHFEHFIKSTIIREGNKKSIGDLNQPLNFYSICILSVMSLIFN